MKLSVYQDYTHNCGALFKALARNARVTDLSYADAEDILQGCLTPEVAALVMPGGASRYVAAKLNGDGNRIILDYIARGGSYIGICAGAYYAARAIVWKEGEPDQILVTNELQLYAGKATGPAPQFQAAEIVPIECRGRQIKALYNQGPLFEEAGSGEVLARYSTLPGKPPAIVSGQYGRGKYLLISPHLEFDSATLEMLRFDVVNNRHAEIAEMASTQGLTTALFHELLTQFLS